MVAKPERGGGDTAAVSHQPRRRRAFNKPSWLLCTIADLDERMKMFTKKVSKESSSSSDSFATRANSYYNERPQLLELLHDLYNGYLSLADRYCQALAKGHHACCDHSSRSLSIVDVESDAESILSFQPWSSGPMKAMDVDPDMVVAELVAKMVECDVVEDELVAVETACDESSRKMELQNNLLDVLESERLILVNDNATLVYRVAALAKENKGLACESLFLKRKATELATCMVKRREDHRVCVLNQKIEDLQGQIDGLEKRNKEYHEDLVKQSDCVKNGRRGVKLWDKVKRFEYLFMCRPQFTSNVKEGC